MFRPLNTAAAMQDLIILGGGAAALCSLIALIRQIRSQHPDGLDQPLHITILERTKHAGNGYPYDPDLQHPILRVNNPNHGMIIDLEDTNDFVNWLRERGAALKSEYPDLAAVIDDNNSGKDLYAPRMLFGRYMQERLAHHTAEAKKLGIHVHTQTGINVTDVIQDSDQHWYFKTDHHGTFSAKNLLIAAGHLLSDKFTDLASQPGYFNTPYTNLAAIPDAPVFVLGSGLSAIDAAKILVHQHHHAPIYMISPSGQLPRVKGPLGAVKYQMQFLTAANLNQPNLRLHAVLDLFADEIKAATGNPAWTIAAVMRMARQENSDAMRTLHREIDWVEQKKVRGWQLMLGQSWFQALPLFWKNLDDRDRDEFLRDYFPLFLKWAAGMTLGNAKEMAALGDAGQLQFIKSRDAVTYNSENQLFQIKTADGKILSAPTVINATGIGTDIRTNPTLHAMVKRGLIRRAPFRGGIDMDEHAHVIAANGNVHENVFAVGIITLGRNLDASSIEITAHAAKKIAPAIMSKLLKNRMNPDTFYSPSLRGGQRPTKQSSP